LNLTALGYYSAPSDLVSRAYLVPAGVVVALFPALSGLARQNKEHLLHVFSLGVKVLLFLLLPITAVLVSFAPAILRVWLGHDYEVHALVVFDILVIGAFISSLGWVPNAYLQAYGRPDLPAKVQLYETPLFAVLVWVLTSRYGINGAAGAWAIRVTGEVIAFFWMARTLDQSVLTGLRKVLLARSLGPVAVLGALIVIRLAAVGNAVAFTNLAVAIGAIAYLRVGWRGVFDAPEREALAGFLVRRS
jgi:O-antigen/teichoic acid export membrane protein